jgi:hypothetical protein
MLRHRKSVKSAFGLWHNWWRVLGLLLRPTLGTFSVKLQFEVHNVMELLKNKKIPQKFIQNLFLGCQWSD